MFNKLAVHSISYQTSRTYTMACNRERFSTRSGQRFEPRLFIYHIKPICLFVFAVVFCKFLYIKYSLYYRGRASVQCHSRPPPIVDGPAASLVYETVEYVFHSRDNVTHFHCESFKQNYDTMMMLTWHQPVVTYHKWSWCHVSRRPWDSYLVYRACMLHA